MDDNKIIHLFITERCTHNCELCCNKQYNIDEIPVITVSELKNAHTICLTGGEPFLYSGVCDFAKRIKEQYPNVQNIYVYTCGDSLYSYMKRSDLHSIDGVSISPKNGYDANCICALMNTPSYRRTLFELKSNRIYVFPNVTKGWIESLELEGPSFDVINRQWQEKFEPAKDSIFRRLPVLFL